jgi:mycothiol synthase
MRARAPVWDDAPAVLELLVARYTADLGLPLFRLDEVEDEWRAPDLDLEQDAILVEIDGAIAGYAIVHGPGAFAVVAPAYEGRGVGAHLLAWGQQRERERGGDTHGQITAAGNERARDLLETNGYHQVRSYWRMMRPLDREVAVAAVPAGITLRGIDLDGDGRALHALDAESFGSLPDYMPEAWDVFAQRHLDARDVAPDLSLVAHDGQRIVGFLLARRWEHERSGYVDLLAVSPGRQRRGLGTALLTHGFAAFAAAGLVQAQLVVASDNPRALRVYEAAGMGPRFRFDVYERPMTPD